MLINVITVPSNPRSIRITFNLENGNKNNAHPFAWMSIIKVWSG